MARLILLVDPDPAAVGSLSRAIGSAHEVDACTSFAAARQRLLHRSYDRMFTNLRLREYNGMHLVHLARPIVRTIVYTGHPDVLMASEIQAIGAFYEWFDRLRYSVASYAQNELPARDRRKPARETRRNIFRGGRRSWDTVVRYCQPGPHMQLRSRESAL